MSYGHDDRTDREYGSRGGSRYEDQGRNRSYARERSPARARTDRDPNCRLYIHNLAYKTSWQDLKDHMRGAGGSVEYVKILQDHEGRSRGAGLVEFSKPEDAQEAIDRLDGSDLDGRAIGVRLDREAGGGGRYSGGGARFEGGGGQRSYEGGSSRGDAYGGSSHRGDGGDRRDSNRDDNRGSRRYDSGGNRGGGSRAKPTSEELNADLDNYNSSRGQPADE